MKDLDLSLLIGLSRTSNTFASETSRIMTAHDLTLSQFAVLEAVVHKGTLSIGEIQRKILSTTGTMPVIIKNLEKRGLVVREQDPTDKRRFYITATQEGHALMDKVFPLNESMIHNKMTCWSQEEKQVLFKLLQKFRKQEGTDHE